MAIRVRSGLRQQLYQEVVAPGGKIEFAAERDLRAVVMHQVQGHMAQNREVIGAVVAAASDLVFVHHDIQDPMQAVLDAPMRAGDLAQALKYGGSIVSYAVDSGQFPVIPTKDLIFLGLRHHGFWLGNWMTNAPSTEIQETYQKLGDLVADGSLRATVEQVYPLERFKEAFEHSLKSNRGGKILFKFNTLTG